jgi:hypothetical protein
LKLCKLFSKLLTWFLSIEKVIILWFFFDKCIWYASNWFFFFDVSFASTLAFFSSPSPIFLAVSSRPWSSLNNFLINIQFSRYLISNNASSRHTTRTVRAFWKWRQVNSRFFSSSVMLSRNKNPIFLPFVMIMKTFFFFVFAVFKWKDFHLCKTNCIQRRIFRKSLRLLRALTKHLASLDRSIIDKSQSENWCSVLRRERFLLVSIYSFVCKVSAIFQSENLNGIHVNLKWIIEFAMIENTNLFLFLGQLNPGCYCCGQGHKQLFFSADFTSLSLSIKHVITSLEGSTVFSSLFIIQ